jgi:hypothetical protein
MRAARATLKSPEKQVFLIMDKLADKLPNMHSTQFAGIPVVVEWPKGSIREGKNPDGSKWKREMNADYGYVPDTSAAGDGEGLDVYLGPNPKAEYAYVIEQLKEDGGFDEFKVMLGFDTLEDAEAMYLSHYPAGWEDTRLGEINEVPFRYLFDAVEEHREEEGKTSSWTTYLKARTAVLKAYRADALDDRLRDAWKTNTMLPAGDLNAVQTVKAPDDPWIAKAKEQLGIAPDARMTDEQIRQVVALAQTLKSQP